MSISLGKDDLDREIPLDVHKLATSGTAILAMRGAGKSWLNAILAEGLAKEKIPFTIIDPEGEYWSLKVGYRQIVVAGGDHQDIPLTPDIGEELADFLVNERLQLIIDLSDMRRKDQIQFLANYLETIFTLETKHRIPLWISLEEADLWVPQSGNPPCKDYVLDICQRGRKRGLGFSLVSQRPAIVDKTALSQAEYRFFKRFQQPHDLSAVRSYLGPFQNAADQLPNLGNNEVLLYAPTLIEKPTILEVAGRTTPHGGATPEQLSRIKPTRNILSLKKKLEELLTKKKMQRTELERLQDRINELLVQLKQVQEENERLRTALEVSKHLKINVVNETTPVHSRDRISTPIHMGEYVEQIDTKGIDIRSGLAAGSRYADLLLNRLDPRERVVLISIKRSRKPLNIKEIMEKTQLSRSIISRITKRLLKMNVIRKERIRERGTHFSFIEKQI